MKKIRVLLAHHPLVVPMAIREILSQQEDMELVGECRGPMSILREAGRTMADAVILAQEVTEEPGLCSQLLAIYPDLTILSVTPGLEVAYMQQLCSHRKTLEIDQQQDIAHTLRLAVRYPCVKP